MGVQKWKKFVHGQLKWPLEGINLIRSNILAESNHLSKKIIQDENVKSRLEKINSQNFEAEKILFAAAWLHDIFDHKYTTEEEAKAGQLKIKSFLENIEFHSGELEPGSWSLFCVGGINLKISIDEIEAIQKICENVSYSKERKGKLEKLEFPTSFLR